MWKKLKIWLGLCEHQWRHATNIFDEYGPREVLMCDKCMRLKFRHWDKR